MENVEFRHTYLCFRKLQEATYLFPDWSNIFDHASMNKEIRAFYLENINLVKRLKLYGNVDLIEITTSGNKFVFMDTHTIQTTWGPSKHLILLVNFYPVGTSYPKSEYVAVDFKRDKRFRHMKKEVEYFRSPNELVEVNGDLYEIEDSSVEYEFTKSKYVINTHEAFCKYCDMFNNGQLNHEANREMWDDFIYSISPLQLPIRRKVKGYYEYVEIGSLKIITDFVEKVS